MLQRLIFVGIMLAVFAPIHFYLWRRLVKDTTRQGSRWRRLGTVAVLLLGLILAGALAGLPLPGGLGFVVAFAGYLWLALMFYLFLVLLAVEVPRAIALRRARKSRAAEEGRVLDIGGAQEGTAASSPAIARRLLITRSVAVFAGLTATGLTGYGTAQALGPPRINRVQIPLAKLPRRMDGYRIALVGDIHLSSITGVRRTRQIVEFINGMDADIVAMVGDLGSSAVDELGMQAEPLHALQARHGRYFVTGNHEYYTGVHEWLAEVQRLGLQSLRNDRVELPGGLDLAGVNDVTGNSFGDAPDFAKALADRDPSKPVVLLAHQPVQAREAAQYGVDLQLSGHTHGGQLAPFNLLVGLQQPVVSGLGEVDGTQVYVTNGAGTWGPPVRVGAPPDVTLIELRMG